METNVRMFRISTIILMMSSAGRSESGGFHGVVFIPHLRIIHTHNARPEHDPVYYDSIGAAGDLRPAAVITVNV